jgi:hypothetical protein
MRSIFVLGCPRSGTTVLGESLQRHPQVCGGTETHFFIPVLQAFDEVWQYSVERLPSHLNWLEAEGIGKEAFLLHYARGLKDVIASRATCERWLDHTGGNVLVWDMLRKVFPDAQFVLIVRDGRNVVESVMHSFWGGPFSFRDATEMWVEHAEAGIAALAVATAGQGHLVTYESVVAAPHDRLREVVDFLGLPWSDEVVTPFTHEPLLNSSFPGDTAGDKLSAKWQSWEGWKRREFEEIGGSMLRHFGYESDAAWAR